MRKDVLTAMKGLDKASTQFKVSILDAILKIKLAKNQQFPNNVIHFSIKFNKRFFPNDFSHEVILFFFQNLQELSKNLKNLLSLWISVGELLKKFIIAHGYKNDSAEM